MVAFHQSVARVAQKNCREVTEEAGMQLRTNRYQLSACSTHTTVLLSVLSCFQYLGCQRSNVPNTMTDRVLNAYHQNVYFVPLHELRETAWHERATRFSVCAASVFHDQGRVVTGQADTGLRN